MRTRGAHIRPHLAAVVIHNQHRTVTDVIGAQPGELLLERSERQLLQAPLEGRLHPFSRIPQPRMREVRREGHRQARMALTVGQAFRQAHELQAPRCVVIDTGNRTGTLAEPRAAAVGRGEQGREHRRFRRGQSRGPLPEKLPRRGTDPLELAVKTREIEIGFEDLLFRPALFESQRRA